MLWHSSRHRQGAKECQNRFVTSISKSIEAKHSLSQLLVSNSCRSLARVGPFPAENEALWSGQKHLGWVLGIEKLALQGIFSEAGFVASAIFSRTHQVSIKEKDEKDILLLGWRPSPKEKEEHIKKMKYNEILDKTYTTSIENYVFHVRSACART